MASAPKALYDSMKLHLQRATVTRWERARGGGRREEKRGGADRHARRVEESTAMVSTKGYSHAGVCKAVLPGEAQDVHAVGPLGNEVEAVPDDGLLLAVVLQQRRGHARRFFQVSTDSAAAAAAPSASGTAARRGAAQRGGGRPRKQRRAALRQRRCCAAALCSNAGGTYDVVEELCQTDLAVVVDNDDAVNHDEARECGLFCL